MANKHKGEVALQVGDAAYTLRLSINDLCNLENSLDRPIDAIMADLSSGSVRLTTLRAITYAALVGSHPSVDLAAAGQIMAEVGMENIVQKLTEAFLGSFPEAKVSTERNPK